MKKILILIATLFITFNVFADGTPKLYQVYTKSDYKALVGSKFNKHTQKLNGDKLNQITNVQVVPDNTQKNVNKIYFLNLKDGQKKVVGETQCCSGAACVLFCWLDGGCCS